MNKPIILIGFKHVGKSALGAALAQYLKINFIDLDLRIQDQYFETLGVALNCRQIAMKHGMEYFRILESSVLKQVIQEKPGVLSVGGGTPLTLENQDLLSEGTVVHIRGRKGMIFERIMITGRPAFFPEGEDPYEAFLRIWSERVPIYEKLADIEIDNAGSVSESLVKIVSALEEDIMA